MKDKVLAAPRLSIIIPTLNEAANISILLDYLREMCPDAEIIVSDGGSRDETAELARPFARVIEGQPGRAIQMNAGAARATGELLWFIHADCRPHAHSQKIICNLLHDGKLAGGAFEFRLDHPHKFYRIMEFFSNLKNRIFKLFYGDMGIFIRKDIFDRIGGYAQIPIMEDIDLCRRLKREGKVVIVPFPILTSARRWENEGRFVNLFRNWVLQCLWISGFSPQLLSRWYPVNSKAN